MAIKRSTSGRCRWASHVAAIHGASREATAASRDFSGGSAGSVHAQPQGLGSHGHPAHVDFWTLQPSTFLSPSSIYIIFLGVIHVVHSHATCEAGTAGSPSATNSSTHRPLLEKRCGFRKWKFKVMMCPLLPCRKPAADDRGECKMAGGPAATPISVRAHDFLQLTSIHVFLSAIFLTRFLTIMNHIFHYPESLIDHLPV